MGKDADGDVYAVKVIYTIEVVATNKKEARDVALDELARLCAAGKGMIVHVERVA